MNANRFCKRTSVANTITSAILLCAVLLGACTSPPTSPAATNTAIPATDTPPAEATALPTEIPPSPTPKPTTPPQPASTPVSIPVPGSTEVKIHYPATTLSKGALIFASFKEDTVTLPAATSPHEPIAPDLSNASSFYLLSETQKERMVQDGFIVNPGDEKEFFVLYEKMRYENKPILVTSDSLLHMYHLLFDKALRSAETEYFVPLLRELNAGLLARSDAMYQELKDGEWEEAARRTVAFVGVAGKLLDPEIQIPEYAGELVEAELALIKEAGGILPSPLFPGLEYGEDYTQYIPRGHYTRSEDLSAYFKSMMWYGRMTFRLKTDDPEVGRAETRMALLLVHTLRTTTIAGRPALEMWEDLYSPTVFFVGRSDDLTVHQYGEVMDEIYGPGATAPELVDEALLDAFIAAAGELPAPRILGIVIFYTDDIEETTKGLRFMGQRFVPDAYVFRELMFRNVGTLNDPRALPNGLDIPAAMGSERAITILDELGETHYLSYTEQMADMQAWTAGVSVEEWTETLYNSWLYSFYPLLEEPDASYPQFMQSQSWLDKQLNTVLGSFAELKHDTILYAKQAYSELGGAPPPPEPVLPPRGYVEPVPQFYARLAALTAMTREGLLNRGMLPGDVAVSLARLEELALDFERMALKELRGEPLSEEEYESLRFYGGTLEQLTIAASDTEEGGYGGEIDENIQAAVIADVATDVTKDFAVLEIGVGRINEIYAVVPLVEEDGSTTLQVVKGGVFSYYEFPWPMEDRLTDQKWHEMLDNDTAPPSPEWTSSFLSPESSYAELQNAIYRFQKSLVNAYWSLNPYGINAAPIQEQISPDIAALTEAQQCQWRRWTDTTLRSVDPQTEDKVIVTTRDTWEDALYPLSEDYGWCAGYDLEDTPLGRRGPYTLDTTYTLEQVDGTWQVTHVVYANEPPDWQ